MEERKLQIKKLTSQDLSAVNPQRPRIKKLESMLMHKVTQTNPELDIRTTELPKVAPFISEEELEETELETFNHAPVRKNGFNTIPVVRTIILESGKTTEVEEILTLPVFNDKQSWIGYKIHYITRANEVWYVRITGYDARGFICGEEARTAILAEHINRRDKVSYHYQGIREKFPPKEN